MLPAGFYYVYRFYFIALILCQFSVKNSWSCMVNNQSWYI